MNDDYCLEHGGTNSIAHCPLCKARAQHNRPADGVIDKAVQYNAGAIECIDAIQAALTPEEFRGFLKGNVLKYTWRERHKGGEESLKKAQWYLARLLALALVLGGVSGCASDFASPFDKPDETTMPVTCSASSPCQE